MSMKAFMTAQAYPRGKHQMSHGRPRRVFTPRIGRLTSLPGSYLLRPTTTTFDRPAAERSSIDRPITSAMTFRLPCRSRVRRVSAGGDNGVIAYHPDRHQPGAPGTLQDRQA